MKIKVKLCPLAKKHHQESARQFAHVLHRRDTICVTPEFYDLPQNYQMGILLHELGHIALKDRDHNESDADEIAFVMSGAHVFRRHYRNMKGLEYVRNYDKRKARAFINKHVEGIE